MNINTMGYFKNDIIYILPELYLLIGIILVILLGINLKNEKKDIIESLNWL